MAWPTSFLNRVSSLFDALEKVWELFEHNPSMFVIFINKAGSNRRIFMAENSDGVKIVRSFLSEEDAQKYKKVKSAQSQDLYIGEMTYSKIYNSIVYIHNAGTPIEWRLTALDVDGNVYDIETLWENKVN